MVARWSRTVHTGLRQLSTRAVQARAVPAGPGRVGAYAAGTIAVGTTLAFAFDSPWLTDRFTVKAEAAPVPSQPVKSEKDGLRRQSLTNLVAKARENSLTPRTEDPDTSILHPVTLPLSSPSTPLTLIGLGVRTVSFLSVRVYSAAFYVEDRTLKQLHHVPGWHVRLDRAPFHQT